MTYKIIPLPEGAIEKKNYIFDANLWLIILKPKMKPSKRELRYLGFFARFKSSPNHPRIMVTSFILSEVINRYLREVSMHKYAEKTGDEITPDYYKRVYRKTEDFFIQYNVLCDEIRSYHNYYDLVPDELGNIFKSKHILKDLPKGLDFNDHLLYKLAKEKGYSIVTDDGDFFVDGVEVITLNTILLEKVAATPAA